MFEICRRNGMRAAGVLVVLGLLIMGGCPSPGGNNNPPPDGNTDGGTPPPSKTGEGPIALLTADDTSLAVGQTTTARLWVQQSSPNATGDNGIFTIGVNVVASPAGIVQSQVPVTFLSAWDTSLNLKKTGTATQAGGIDQVVSLPQDITDRTQGIAGPVQVFHFQVQAVAPGTVTLTPTNFIGGGSKGVFTFDSTTGDESKYVPVQITVQ